MRHLRLFILFASVLLTPTLALAQAAPATAPGAPDAPRASAAGAAGAGIAAKPVPGTPLAEPPSPGSRALAITIEMLSPVGGAGCFYQRHYLAGALVIAGSLIMGGSLIYAVKTSDRDATIAHALGYGLLRSLGVAAAAQTYSASGFQDPAPRVSPPPALATRTVGFSYRFSF